MMNNLVEDIDRVELHRDHASVHASDEATHYTHLSILFQRFLMKMLLLIQRKFISVIGLECLGYLAVGNGFKPDPVSLWCAVLYMNMFPLITTGIFKLIYVCSPDHCHEFPCANLDLHFHVYSSRHTN